jgi:CBS-domain-containing membrane protein
MPLVQMFDRIRFPSVLAGAVGGAVAIVVMEAFSIRREFPLWAIPFATSIVTVLGSPESKPAQPRALVGGHLIATIVGLVVVKIWGPDPWAAAVAVGLAMIAMHLSDTFHPPAGIDPLLVVVDDISWRFLFVPVGIGAFLLVVFAFAWYKLVALGPNKNAKWPVRWW